MEIRVLHRHGKGVREIARETGVSRNTVRRPELNPVERVWLYLRDRYLSHRLLDDYPAIVDACCRAWNALTAETGRIRSLGAYPYLDQVSS